MTNGHRGTVRLPFDRADQRPRRPDAARRSGAVVLETEQPSLDERKKSLRSEAKRRRAEAAVCADGGADGGAADRAGEALCARVLAAPVLPARCIVSAYWPKGSEIDPRPLMRCLDGRGHSICLPVVTGRGRPLLFRAWQPGDPLEPAGFGILVPGAERPEREPRVVLVPMLAFDRAGYRLGYGGGYYDRTLAGRRAGPEVLAVGLAYAAQEVPAVPHDDHDQPLDWIVTEAEAIEIG